MAGESTTILGRYRIIRELGAGGMGRVLLAYDEDLNEQVALKLIRREYSSPAAEERFKREITLARRISHPNVIRIHDTGIADGERFISMAFVDGVDLAALIRREPLSCSKAIDIVAQICDGLASAHKAGVVHRDLKPANIMVGRNGHAYLMDFGLASGVEASTISLPGSILGTVDYMSPEQARGEPADARADVFAVGVILFELLTGKLPFDGDSSMSRLSARLNHTPPDVKTMSADVPQAINDVVRKCLAVDRDARYQTAAELREALLSGAPARVGFNITRPVLGAAVAAVVVIVGLWSWRSRPVPPPQETEVTAVKVAVLPLRNASSDATADWFGSAVSNVVLARMTDVSGVRPLTVARLASVIGSPPPGPRPLEDLLGRVREFTNADAILSGHYVVDGTQLRIDGAIRLAGRKDTVPLPTQTASLDQVDAVAETLAAALSRSLGRPQPKPVRAAPERAPAITRLYREAVELSSVGKHPDAVRRLLEATTADNTFAEAWGALAAAYAGLRQDRDAVSAVRKASDLSAGLPPRDRFKILALQATIQRDNAQAIAAYSEWLKVTPEDSDACLRLAELYESIGNFDASQQRFTELIERDPLYFEALLGSGRVAIRKGTPADGIEPLTRALSLAIRLDNDAHKASAYQALGVAYKNLNRAADALASYEQALELRRRLGLKAAAASTLNEMAQVYERMGHVAEAEKHYVDSLTIQRGLGNRAGETTAMINLAAFYEDAGDLRRALRMVQDALTAARDLGNEDQEALCLSNIGNIHLDLGELQTATVFFERALAIRRRLKLPRTSADTLHNLADTARLTGDFESATRLINEVLAIRQQIKDERGTAYANYELGVIRFEQGRLLASANAMRDAEASVRVGEDTWYPEIAARYAAARAMLGECDGLGSRFEKPLSLTRVTRPRELSATLLAQAEALMACGDIEAAARVSEAAVDSALRSNGPPHVLAARLQLARVRSAAGRSNDARSLGADVAAQSKRLGLRSIAAGALIEVADAQLSRREFAAARQSAREALALSDKTGSWLQLARANHLLAQALRGLGNTDESAKHLAEARQWVGEIRKEAGTDAVLNSTGLKPILETEEPRRMK